jgi:hypothetical protein
LARFGIGLLGEKPMTVAVVAKKSPYGLHYLAGATPYPRWSMVEQQATRYPDVHSATRAALTISSRHRAFALPTAGHSASADAATTAEGNLRRAPQRPVNIGARFSRKLRTPSR